MIHVNYPFSTAMSCSAAAAPPFLAISGKSTPSLSFTSLTHQKSLNRKYKLVFFQLHYSPNRSSIFSQYLFLSAFSVALLILRLTSGVILPDFSHRWRQLIAFSSQAEAELIDAPDYLLDAAVAYEDRRFFSHFGVDAIGVARAVLSLSARGGGSTITQQLVKNTLLKNERTILRKFVEMLLAVELERRISKSRILSAYLCKIYWGHGIYGIKSASKFYFGKHPSALTLGECALLIGMIPAPEVRSPFRDYSRGKTFQARVLKRMVNGRFLDTEAALSAMRKSDVLKSAGLDAAEHLLHPMSSSAKRCEESRNKEDSGEKVMAYVERGVVKSKRSLWRLKTITDFFWAIINLIGVFFTTMFSMEKSEAYRKGSGASKKWDGGGPGGPGSGPYGGGPRGPPRGLDNVRGIDHSAAPACGSCCG